MSPSSTHVCARRRRRIDPVLAVAFLLLAGAAIWIAAPMATGAAPAPAAGNLALRLDVPAATSVTPGLASGDTSVRLPNLTLPGDPQDATSTGWKLTTNWANGYEVRIRSTSNPALRGSNSVEGGAQDSFADFSTGADCPCPWSADGSPKGVFGFSASVTGPAVVGASKWGTASARKWRGLNKSSYQVFSTSGGSSQYNMSLAFRSEIPQSGTQTAGAYRASFVISVSPLL